MKRLSLWLTMGVTLVLLITVGVFSFVQASDSPATSTATPAAALNSTTPQAMADMQQQLQRLFNDRERSYQQQIAQLNQAIADHQKAYQTQLQTLTTQVTNGQQLLQQSKEQVKAYQQQVDKLASVRNENQGQYQGQLQDLQKQYDDRYAQITAQIAAVQAKLDEANQTLGH